MKKQALIAAVLAATTLTAASATPAFAKTANPFKDLPADHWAYDAVAMLAKDGVLDGYGDGNFNGTKLMNRYEMAEIVAKAAQKYGSARPADKGAIKKLQREFSAELKDMDSRLTAVEGEVTELKKNQSSFKWYGDTRLRYMQNKDGKYFKTMKAPGGLSNGNEYKKKAHQLETRVRLGLWGEPAKNVTVSGRLKLENVTDKHDGWSEHGLDGNSNNNSFRLDKMEFDWNAKNGFVVAAGRMEKTFGQGLIWWENPIDGFSVQKNFGGKGNVQFGWGDLSAENWGQSNDKWMPAFFTDGALHLSPATTLTATYLKAKQPDGTISVGSVNEWGWLDSWGKKQKYELNQMAFGLNTQLASKWNVSAEYVRNNIDTTGRANKDGFWTRVTYGKQDWHKANTWKVYGEYVALGNYAIDSTGWGHHMNFAGGNGLGSDNGGARGWGLGASYMLAPNTNVETCWYFLKPYDTSFGKYETQGLASFTFSF